MRRCLERRKWERGCGWWPRRRCGAGFMVRTALPWWLDFAGFVCCVHHQKRLNGVRTVEYCTVQSVVMLTNAVAYASDFIFVV
jgi:hypothetical protein